MGNNMDKILPWSLELIGSWKLEVVKLACWYVSLTTGCIAIDFYTDIPDSYWLRWSPDISCSATSNPKRFIIQRNISTSTGYIGT